MSEPFGELIDDLLRGLQTISLPGHPDGPRVVSMSVKEALDLFQKLAAEHSRRGHVVITDPGKPADPESVQEVRGSEPRLLESSDRQSE